jgi:hypothetical protein
VAEVLLTNTSPLEPNTWTELFAPTAPETV